MNRRRFFLALAAIPAAPPLAARAAFDPPLAFPAGWAAVAFTGDDPIRAVTVRVSRWARAEAAEQVRALLDAGAGSNLPMGEFYQSEVKVLPVPADRLAQPATLSTWYTSVGAAGYVTDWACLTVRRDTLLWEIRAGGAEDAPVGDLAITLAATLTARQPDDDLTALLPTQADLPDGLSLAWRSSPDGAFDPEGTPIPEPTPMW